MSTMMAMARSLATDALRTLQRREHRDPAIAVGIGLLGLAALEATGSELVVLEFLIHQMHLGTLFFVGTIFALGLLVYAYRRGQDLSLALSDRDVLSAALQKERDSLERRVVERTREMAQLNGRLFEALGEIRAADRAKGEFLARMSHELRTPLNAIIGYTELLRETAEIDRREEDLVDHERILRAATHLLQLINDLLDFSKIEAGKMEVHPQQLNLPVFLVDVLDTIRPTADKNGVHLKLNAAPSLGFAYTDAARLRQCLLNLLANACKFARNGVVELRVSRCQTVLGQRLRFEVEDDGIGMSAEQQARLFQPFVQATAETHSQFGGTGLGLAVTRELARLLGGDVSVMSEQGVGSVFTIEVSAALEGAATVDEQAA